jgi:thiol:disulfide interchange protein
VKFIFRILFLSAVALVAAACASTSATPTRETAPTVTPDITPDQDVSDQAYAPSDVSLVANTGKPQFLDSYADW